MGQTQHDNSPSSECWAAQGVPWLRGSPTETPAPRSQGRLEPRSPLLALHWANTKPLEISVRGPVQLSRVALTEAKSTVSKAQFPGGKRNKSWGELSPRRLPVSPRLVPATEAGARLISTCKMLQNFVPLPAKRQGGGLPRSSCCSGCRQSIKCSESGFTAGKWRLCKQLMGVFQFPINCIFITRLLQGNVMLR